MAITHTHEVESLKVLNDGKNVVSRVVVKTTSVNDLDSTNLTHFDSNSFDVNTSGGNTAVGFVTFSNLNENTVKGWISSELSVIETNHELTLAGYLSKKNFVSDEAGKSLPW